MRDAADLANHAEAALVPGDPQPERSAEERLADDQRLVDVILAEGLQGPRRQELERELIKYAVPVLNYLLRSGEIFSKASRLGRPVGNSDAWLDFTDLDRDELARDMVADALPVFTRAVFEERRWSPPARCLPPDLLRQRVRAAILRALPQVARAAKSSAGRVGDRPQ